MNVTQLGTDPEVAQAALKNLTIALATPGSNTGTALRGFGVSAAEIASSAVTADVTITGETCHPMGWMSVSLQARPERTC